MLKTNYGLILLVLVSMGSLMSCAKNSDTGTAKLQFSNSQNSPLGYMNMLDRLFTQKAFAATMSQPTEFKMKLIAAYLAADVDPVTGNNVGETGTFYVNPECHGDLMHCDVSGGTAEDGKPIAHVIDTFFDFGQGSDLVNQALNAEGLSIPAAEYKYVRLEFCKLNQEGTANINWQGGTNNSETPFTKSECTVTSVVMNPPLSIGKGETATVKLAYDYSNSIQVGVDAQGDNCSGSGDTKSCFSVPEFTPSATK